MTQEKPKPSMDQAKSQAQPAQKKESEGTGYKIAGSVTGAIAYVGIETAVLGIGLIILMFVMNLVGVWAIPALLGAGLLAKLATNFFDNKVAKRNTTLRNIFGLKDVVAAPVAQPVAA